MRPSQAGEVEKSAALVNTMGEIQKEIFAASQTVATSGNPAALANLKDQIKNITRAYVAFVGPESEAGRLMLANH